MPDLTHHPERWRDPEHHACAVGAVERMEQALGLLGESVIQARAQRDGLRNLLGSVYRKLRDGREVSPSQMEALRICYDRRRPLERVEEGGE